LQQLHLFSVPTVYREPKGLYVLEALAAGVPVVQPDHGAFPEILADTGGGRLVPPHSPTALADAWHELLLDHATRQQLAVAGRTAVERRFNAHAMAQQTLTVLQQLITP
jgi:glycosyltransferase involved in cell wall biosynthesis